MCGDRRRAGGLTLIEVLAATALLGGLLASAVVVQGRMAERADHVLRVRDAAEAADRLITAWYTRDDSRWRRGVPRNGGGVWSLPGGGSWVDSRSEARGDRRWVWSTRSRPLSEASPDVSAWEGVGREPARLEIVTVRLFDAGRGSEADAGGLVQVELVLPTPGVSPGTLTGATPGRHRGGTAAAGGGGG